MTYKETMLEILKDVLELLDKAEIACYKIKEFDDFSEISDAELILDNLRDEIELRN